MPLYEHVYLARQDITTQQVDAITKTSFEKIIDHTSCESQTGPAVREDYQLMKKHLKVLKSYTSMSKIYKTLSDSIIQYKNKHNESS